MAKRRGRGEGGLETLPSGKVRAVICRVVGGKRVRESKSFRTKREALDWRAERLRQGPSSAVSLSEWVAQWLTLHAAEVARSTLEDAKDVAGNHVVPHLGAAKLRDLTPLRVSRWLAQLKADGVGQVMRHKAGACLRKCLNSAVRNGLIPANPIDPKKGARVPALPKSRAHALDRDRLSAVVAAADDFGFGAAYRVAADSGCRPAELIGLQVGDFDPATGTLTIQRSVCKVTGELKPTKTGRIRTVRLTPSTAGALRAHLDTLAAAAPGDPLFPAPRGGHWCCQTWRDRCGAVRKACGVAFTPYTLRHTCATLLLRAGVNVKVVAERLGHADVALTLRTYTHVMEDMQDKAVDAMEAILGPAAVVRSERTTAGLTPTPG